MIRFVITKGDEVQLTPWINEPVKHGTTTAADEVAKLRQEHGAEALIKIERRTVIEPLPREQIRFKIQDGTSLYYSKQVHLSEQDMLEEELKQKFPKAVLTLEVTHG